MEIEQLEDRRLLATLFIPVTTTADNGDDTNPTRGSLRAAIIDANNNVGLDYIDFNVANAPQTITVKKNPLPPISSPVNIDAAITPDSKPDQTITILAGAGLPKGANGLTFEGGADNSRVYGLTIRGFSKGSGIQLNNVSFVQIGGTGAKQGDTIIMNGTGVDITGSDAKNNTLFGDYIGTDANSTTKLGNTGNGVVIEKGASSNNIGGLDPKERNIISGNGGNGVLINGGTDPSNLGANNKVIGNYIGTVVKGDSGLGNAGDGVSILNAPNTQIGTNVKTDNAGVIIQPANVISGNGKAGLRLLGSASTGTTVQGNFIGIDAGGTSGFSVDNNSYGIYLGGKQITIGGPQGGAANVISNNGSSGIFVSGSNNTIQITLSVSTRVKP